MEERLQKYMAHSGVASRRKCEELILNGAVKVNGIVISELGYKVDPDKDEILVNNKKISKVEEKIYIKLNKPTGYITTVKDEKNRKTVIDLINIKERIYPIGRLDYDTSGLLLLTNDGDIYNRIMHPSKEINKTYIATVKGVVKISDIDKFEKGIDIGGYITSPSKLEILKISNNTSEVKITIHEGKNRQIRRMCEAINHPVISLKRISVGEIKLDNDLKIGKWKTLSKKELDYIKSL